MTQNASELFDVFVQAKTALEELPKVQADLKETQALAESYSQDLDKEKANSASLSNEITALRAQLAAQEAALSDATKSRDEATKLIDSIRNMLPGITIPASAPVAEVTAGEVNRQEAQVETHSDPTPFVPTADHSATTVENGSATVTVSVAIPSSNPTEVANTATLANPSADTSNPSTASPGSDPTPTSPATTPNTDRPVVEKADFHGGPEYYNKPTDMSWAKWQSIGGTVPQWVYDYDQA